MLEMVRNPDAQRRAQEELDRVVGRGRLPDFDDRPSMPFLEAVLRETERLHPVANLGECLFQIILRVLTKQGLHTPRSKRANIVVTEFTKAPC